MTWGVFDHVVNGALTLALIVRLLALRLHSVYGVFCAFLLFDLLASSIVWIERGIHSAAFDYRWTWIGIRVVTWVLSLWMIYALVTAILLCLPGILRFSRRLLNLTFLLAFPIGVLTVRPDLAFRPSGFLGFTNPVGQWMGITFGVERAVSTAALIVLLCMLGFVLWFPVQMSRNLVVFSAGFVIYFTAKTALLLTRDLWSRQTYAIFSNINIIIFSACLAYWLFLITAAGERVSVKLGHRWHVREQERLLGELEAMNTALLRAARR